MENSITNVEINQKLSFDPSTVLHGHIILNVLNFATGKKLPIFIDRDSAENIVKCLIDNFDMELQTGKKVVADIISCY